jgi:hypothetical protein
MSDENGQGIGGNVYDEDELIEDEEAITQPVEVVREEIVTVTKTPNTEENDSDDLYKIVKAHSDQISRLTDMVESLVSNKSNRPETNNWQQN